MIIKLLVEGGAMKPGPALSQKIGPLGMNIGEIISKVNDSTKDFKGLKVPVELDVDAGTKQFEVKVSSPPVSELLKKELGLEKASGEQLRLSAGNASIEQIISVAKTKMPNLLAKNLKAGVKSVVGTCTSLGILVENKFAPKFGKAVDKGDYDKEINEEKTETSPEKKKKLDAYFKKFKAAQEKSIKEAEAAEEEAKAEKEAAKVAAAAEDTETTEAPAEGEEAPAEGAESTEAKPEENKE
jgi:large subunit ribosomal protein L11